MSKLVQLKRVTDGTWWRTLWKSEGEAPSRWAIFIIFWKQMAYLIPFGSHFARFQSHLKEQNF